MKNTESAKPDCDKLSIDIGLFLEILYKKPVEE